MGIPVATRGKLVVLENRQGTKPRSHEKATQYELAKKLASLMNYDFGGEFEPAETYNGPLYFVPSDTFVSVENAALLGILTEADLFGGVVPFSFVATKSITHGLIGRDSPAPIGWSPGFARAVVDVVLPGYTVFTQGDAFNAGLLLLEQGTVRLKETDGIGGLGQSVVSDPRQLEARISSFDADTLLRHGLVLEKNLADVETYSVGQVCIGDLTATYYGVQRLTRNNHGKEVYGGSDLIVVRGDFDSLLRLDISDHMRTAIAQACTYHQAAMKSFPGMFASRCNYDVVRGYDEHGQLHSGVLEQSWRMGGASGAELAALAAFKDDPALTRVRASTVETYAENPILPADAFIYYQGRDPDAGPLTKYSRWEVYAGS